ncbi:hypothetical protein PAPYR_1341 [Paratrimastix pyriformis]|uniref:Uncharacterized protein n=1 Tax=Paratrimastix pyriformis TaxID=342808 RepID=A0ABQ8USQ1_9EUKA|nr:hypothetical protein PAPYR_1341 [Paratrimastix pyriformis]
MSRASGSRVGSLASLKSMGGVSAGANFLQRLEKGYWDSTTLMLKGNDIYRILAIIFNVIEVFQLFGFVFVSKFEWADYICNFYDYFLSFLGIRKFLFMGTIPWLSLFCIAATMVLAVVTITTYLAHVLQKGEIIKRMSIVSFLRGAVLYTITIANIPVFTTPLDEISFYARIVLACVGVPLLITHAGFAIIMCFALNDSSYSSEGLFGRLHSRMHAHNLMLKMIMVTAFTVAPSSILLLKIVALVTALLLLINFIVFQPFYRRTMNMLWTGSTCPSPTRASCCSSSSGPSLISLVCVATLVPVFLLGMGLSALRLSALQPYASLDGLVTDLQRADLALQRQQAGPQGGSHLLAAGAGAMPHGLPVGGVVHRAIQTAQSMVAAPPTAVGNTDPGFPFPRLRRPFEAEIMLRSMVQYRNALVRQDKVLTFAKRYPAGTSLQVNMARQQLKSGRAGAPNVESGAVACVIVWLIGSSADLGEGGALQEKRVSRLEVEVAAVSALIEYFFSYVTFCFPQHPLVVLMRANYLFTIQSNPSEATTTHRQLEGAEVPFYLRPLSAKLGTTLRGSQTTDTNNMSFLQGVAFEQDYRLAERSRDIAHAQLTQFWKLLRRCLRQQRDRKAGQLPLWKLLSRATPRVLRSYAVFLERIYRVPEQARDYIELAEELEQETNPKPIAVVAYEPSLLSGRALLGPGGAVQPAALADEAALINSPGRGGARPPALGRTATQAEFAAQEGLSPAAGFSSARSGGGAFTGGDPEADLADAQEQQQQLQRQQQLALQRRAAQPRPESSESEADEEAGPGRIKAKAKGRERRWLHWSLQMTGLVLILGATVVAPVSTILIKGIDAEALLVNIAGAVRKFSINVLLGCLDLLQFNETRELTINLAWYSKSVTILMYRLNAEVMPFYAAQNDALHRAMAGISNATLPSAVTFAGTPNPEFANTPVNIYNPLTGNTTLRLARDALEDVLFAVRRLPFLAAEQPAVPILAQPEWATVMANADAMNGMLERMHLAWVDRLAATMQWVGWAFALSFGAITVLALAVLQLERAIRADAHQFCPAPPTHVFTSCLPCSSRGDGCLNMLRHMVVLLGAMAAHGVARQPAAKKRPVPAALDLSAGPPHEKNISPSDPRDASFATSMPPTPGSPQGSPLSGDREMPRFGPPLDPPAPAGLLARPAPGSMLLAPPQPAPSPPMDASGDGAETSLLVPLPSVRLLEAVRALGQAPGEDAVELGDLPIRGSIPPLSPLAIQQSAASPFGGPLLPEENPAIPDAELRSAVTPPPPSHTAATPSSPSLTPSATEGSVASESETCSLGAPSLEIPFDDGAVPGGAAPFGSTLPSVPSQEHLSAAEPPRPLSVSRRARATPQPRSLRHRYHSSSLEALAEAAHEEPQALAPGPAGGKGETVVVIPPDTGHHHHRRTSATKAAAGRLALLDVEEAERAIEQMPLFACSRREGFRQVGLHLICLSLFVIPPILMINQIFLDKELVLVGALSEIRLNRIGDLTVDARTLDHLANHDATPNATLYAAVQRRMAAEAADLWAKHQEILFGGNTTSYSVFSSGNQILYDAHYAPGCLRQVPEMCGLGPYANLTDQSYNFAMLEFVRRANRLAATAPLSPDPDDLEFIAQARVVAGDGGRGEAAESGRRTAHVHVHVHVHVLGFLVVVLAAVGGWAAAPGVLLQTSWFDLEGAGLKVKGYIRNEVTSALTWTMTLGIVTPVGVFVVPFSLLALYLIIRGRRYRKRIQKLSFLTAMVSVGAFSNGPSSHGRGHKQSRAAMGLPPSVSMAGGLAMSPSGLSMAGMGARMGSSVSRQARPYG